MPNRPIEMEYWKSHLIENEKNSESSSEIIEEPNDEPIV